MFLHQWKQSYWNKTDSDSFRYPLENLPYGDQLPAPKSTVHTTREKQCSPLYSLQCTVQITPNKNGTDRERKKQRLSHNPLSAWSFSSVRPRPVQSLSCVCVSPRWSTQTGRARELKFGDNIHPSPHVPCHMSHVSRVRSHMSGVACQFFLLFSNILVELAGEGSVINRANPV